MPQNKSIRDFFKPAQTNVKAAIPAPHPARQSSSTTFHTPSNPAPSKPQTNYTNSDASRSSGQLTYTSSLSPPPSSDTDSPPENLVLPALSSNGDSGRVVKNSDDEDSDSNDSFPDIFQSSNRPLPAKQATPATPSASRFRNAPEPLSSPTAYHSKYKFNLKDLVNEEENDKRTEESSKRFKARFANQDIGNSDSLTNGHDSNPSKLDGVLLESVVRNKDEGGMEKVTRALLRTEATNVEKRWYFFKPQDQQVASPKHPFPTSAVPQTWKGELSKPTMRNQTFISGFAEDMVHFGQALPDEIFLWILDEACVESGDVLRNSYLKTLKESSEQVRRLITPDLVDKVLQILGGTSEATTITEKIRPSLKIASRYPSDWENLRSVVLFFTSIADMLQQSTREHVICMLLRMSVDHVVFKTVDLLDLIQQAVTRLCRKITVDKWETSCQAICKKLFDCVEQPSLRLQIVDAVSSVNSRSHELRRRLAMCFYFNDESYAADHPHTTFDIEKFIERLYSADFDINSETDFPQLAALVSLLDIAVDDGRCLYLDLTNSAAAGKFDQHVDELVYTIKDVMKSIGNPGAAYISKIEAKEALELVSQRIADTLLSRPKAKKSMFDGVAKKELDYSVERDKMSKFTSRMKKETKPVNGQVITA